MLGDTTHAQREVFARRRCACAEGRSGCYETAHAQRDKWLLGDAAHAQRGISGSTAGGFWLRRWGEAVPFDSAPLFSLRPEGLPGPVPQPFPTMEVEDDLGEARGGVGGWQGKTVSRRCGLGPVRPTPPCCSAPPRPVPNPKADEAGRARCELAGGVAGWFCLCVTELML